MNELTRHLLGRVLWQVLAIVTLVVLVALTYHSLSNGMVFRRSQWERTVAVETKPVPDGKLGLADLVKLRARPDVYLADARPHEDFLKGHIPGARSLPLADLPKWYRIKRPLLGHAGVIVVYGAGNDALAQTLVRHLRRDGLERAVVFRPGLAGWTKAGQPLETGPERPR